MAPADVFQASVTCALPGVAVRFAGAGGAEADWTVSEMVAVPVRPWTSFRVTGSDLAPSVVAFETVAVNENVPSPPVASPLVPLSKSVCEALPPIDVRLTLTVMPVEVGFCPGDAATVRRDD